MKNNGLFAFDLETFAQCFTATFLSLNSDDCYQFVIHESRDDRYELVDFLTTVKGLVGFNSISFDSPLLRYLIQHHTEPNLANLLFQMAQRLISDRSYDDDEIRQLRYPKQSDWRDLDLMKLKALDAMGVSLKQVGINIRHPKVQDLPFPYDAEISADQIQVVLDYNFNDVEVTRDFYRKLQPEIELRREIRKMYGIDVASASDSKIANLMLESMITDDKDELKEIRQKRTHRESVKISDCIPHNLQFTSPELCGMLDKLMGITVTSSHKFHYDLSVRYAQNKFQLGIGGLHTDDPSRILESDDQYKLLDCDVSSFYPSIILQLGVRPAHLGDKFNQIFRKMTEDRLQAKKNGDKVRADSLKITINATFGKMGSMTFWLYDPLAMLRVTVAGQLYLLQLVEYLHQSGIEVVSANTDGVVCRVSTSKEDAYYSACNRWIEQTGFQLEYQEYRKLIQKDINNYIAIKADGKTKEKGIFADTTDDARKAFKFPIIQKALYQYFVENVPIERTITDCKDVYEFCTSQKMGGQFSLELHTLDGIQKLQKTNRFAIAKAGGGLVKRNRHDGSETRLYAGENVVLLNDIDPNTPFEQYGIKTEFYIKEVKKIVEQIEPRIVQMALFS